MPEAVQPLAAGQPGAPAVPPPAGARPSLSEAVSAFARKLDRGDHRRQFALALALAAACGCLNKLQLFPMNSIAGPSRCSTTLDNSTAAFEPALKSLSCVGTASAAASLPGHGAEQQLAEVAVSAISARLPDCAEEVDFVVDSFTVRTNYLVNFGLVKAVMNFVTGVLADRYGRRRTMLLGWLAALPMPLIVLWAGSWAVVSATNLLLGLQQAICWSTSIFIMLDYAGKEHGGLAVGLNESAGYVALALTNLLAPVLLDAEEPRGACYYAVLGAQRTPLPLVADGIGTALLTDALLCWLRAVVVMAGLVSSALLLKDTREVVAEEQRANPPPAAAEGLSDHPAGTGGCVLELPSGEREDVSVSLFAFVYTSFMQPKLIVINLAGMTVNFLAAMAWGLLLQWLKQGGAADAAGDGGWAALDTADVASIALSDPSLRLCSLGPTVALTSRAAQGVRFDEGSGSVRMRLPRRPDGPQAVHCGRPGSVLGVARADVARRVLGGHRVGRAAGVHGRRSRAGPSLPRRPTTRRLASLTGGRES